MARFEVVDGGREDRAQASQDDEDALEALARIIGGPEAENDAEVAARARRQASEIMGSVDDTPIELRSEDGPPAG